MKWSPEWATSGPATLQVHLHSQDSRSMRCTNGTLHSKQATQKASGYNSWIQMIRKKPQLALIEKTLSFMEVLTWSLRQTLTKQLQAQTNLLERMVMKVMRQTLCWASFRKCRKPNRCWRCRHCGTSTWRMKGILRRSSIAIVEPKANSLIPSQRC